MYGFAKQEAPFKVDQFECYMQSSGFPVADFEGDRLGLVIAFWGLALQLGTPQVSQTDYNEKKETFGAQYPDL